MNSLLPAVAEGRRLRRQLEAGEMVDAMDAAGFASMLGGVEALAWPLPPSSPPPPPPPPCHAAHRPVCVWQGLGEVALHPFVDAASQPLPSYSPTAAALLSEFACMDLCEAQPRVQTVALPTASTVG